jgi:hypothetical protein
MLFRQDGTEFAKGRSRFLDYPPGSPERTSKIFVKIQVESFDAVVFAQLDTGAAWSMLDAEVAEILSLLGGEGEPVTVSTRLGKVNGRLERTSLAIVADEGESISIDATVVVSPDWHAGNFLGYSGLLERVRFALDPSDNSFYFGSI